MELQLNFKNGKTAMVTLTDISEKKITLDENHPLAGKEIFYQITLLETVKGC